MISLRMNATLNLPKFGELFHSVVINHTESTQYSDSNYDKSNWIWKKCCVQTEINKYG